MILDELTILIDADAKGIENTLKKTLGMVTGTIGQMNKQEVDWTSIFTRSVSPAIIGAVASMFALAISNLVSFNNAATNLNNNAIPATDALGNTIGMTTDQIYGMAQAAGRGMGETTAAFNAFTKAGLDGAAATYAVQEASQIAFASGQDFASVVKELSELFSNWGVTSTPQVTNALTGLVNAAQNGKFTFDELVKTISDQGGILKGSTNISDLSLNLAALSAQSGLTKKDVVDTFQAIAQGVSNPLNNINLLIGNMSKAITSGPDGLITAFEMIKTKVDQYGPAVAATVLSSTGLSSAAIKDFGGITRESLEIARMAVDDLRAHLVPLDTDLENHTSFVAKVMKAWNQFVNFMSSVISPALSAIGKDFQMLGDSINEVFGTQLQQIGAHINEEVSKWSKAIGTANQLLFQGGLGADIYDLLHPADAQNGGVSNPTQTTNNNSNSNTKLNTTININGGNPVSAKDIASQLYQMFQGTK